MYTLMLTLIMSVITLYILIQVNGMIFDIRWMWLKIKLHKLMRLYKAPYQEGAVLFA